MKDRLARREYILIAISMHVHVHVPLQASSAQAGRSCCSSSSRDRAGDCACARASSRRPRMIETDLLILYATRWSGPWRVRGCSLLADGPRLACKETSSRLATRIRGNLAASSRHHRASMFTPGVECCSASHRSVAERTSATESLQPLNGHTVSKRDPCSGVAEVDDGEASVSQ
jgi:hypothetical protein